MSASEHRYGNGATELIMLMLIDRVTRAFAVYFGGLILSLLLVLTVTDVIGRYFFDWPVYGSLDLYGVLLASVVAVSIPYGARTGAHVSADVFAQLAGPKTERVIAIIIRFVSASVAAVWAWHLYAAGNTAAMLEESTQLLGIPFQPIYYILATGIALFAVILSVETWLLIVAGQVPLLIDNSQMTMDSPDE